MAFEVLRAEIGLLLEQARETPEDRHELYQIVQLKFGEMRAFGMPIPQDLIDLEAELETEFSDEMSQPPPKA